VLRYVVSRRGGFYDVVGAEPVERVVAMAICQYEGASELYLFGCNARWEVVADTDCASVEDGMQMAAQGANGEALIWIVA